MPNCFGSTPLCTNMDDIDSDAKMVAAGVVISAIAILEFYPAWKNTQTE